MFNMRKLFRDSQGISQGERMIIGFGCFIGRSIIAWGDDDHITSHAGNGISDTLFDPHANGNHDDNRGNANNHAEHCQGRT